jgi:fatty acid desaturase
MDEPNEADFGLSTELLQSIEAFNARQNKRADRCTAAIYAAALLAICVVWGLDIALMAVLASLFLWVLPFMIVGFVIQSLFFRSHRLTKSADAYRKAVGKYQIWKRRTTFAYWQGLSGFQFEVEVTRLLVGLGYRCQRRS